MVKKMEFGKLISQMDKLNKKPILKNGIVDGEKHNLLFNRNFYR
jgi:hypothetical protein